MLVESERRPQAQGGKLLTADERELVVKTVRRFVAEGVIPVASEMEHHDQYPEDLVGQMKAMGLFGMNVPEQYGGLEVGYTILAQIFEEISRGWMGLAGVLGTHMVLCDVLATYGTEEQKSRFLPRLATGETRGGICLSEPNAGTDLQAITTIATRKDDHYLINGSKMWVTNGRRATTFLLLT